MQKLLKLPLIFLFIASLIGFMLRWHRVQPVEKLTYAFWLHAHSHLMFLGWVFNALSIGFVLYMVPEHRHRRYTVLLVMINVLLAGMLIAFPLQGYGGFSILLSTLHTALVVVLIVRFYKDSRSTPTGEPGAFARLSLILFVVSSLGPFALGFMAANGLGHSQWYQLAVYYYLHFQYNGVFTFGVMALFYRLLDDKGVEVDRQLVRMFRMILFAACFPAYVLSVLWTSPSWIFHVTGFLAALAQMVSLMFFVRSIRCSMRKFLAKFSAPSRVLLVAAFLAFVIKLILQVFSAFPSIAMLAYEVRFYVIAYLHLVLIGMISFFLLVWYCDIGAIRISWFSLGLLLLGFVGSEVLMISVGYFPMRLIHIGIAGATLLLTAGMASVAVHVLLTRNSVRI